MVLLERPLAPWFIQPETVIIPENQETPECPFNQPQPRKRQFKPVVKAQVGDSSLIVKLLKNRVSTFEKDLIEKKYNYRFSFEGKR